MLRSPLRSTVWRCNMGTHHPACGCQRLAPTRACPPARLPAGLPTLQERQLYAAELEANNGVLYRAELIAVPAPESIAADKGIKRAADKVSRHACLPPCIAANRADAGRLPACGCLPFLLRAKCSILWQSAA
jgi:hypothetical protein